MKKGYCSICDSKYNTLINDDGICFTCKQWKNALFAVRDVGNNLYKNKKSNAYFTKILNSIL